MERFATRADRRNSSIRTAAVVPTTDLANAERFVAQHGASVRFCHAWRQWLVWNGRRWQPDTTGEVWRLAKQTAKKITLEAAVADDAEFKQLTAWASKSQARARLDAMLALAESEQPIPVEYQSLDADPWALNFENCTIDLQTGQARPHDPADLFTKTTGVEYPDEPGVDAVLWEEFLHSIFDGDAELIGYLQRLLGSALVGVVREHLLPIFHGGGSNGKSVLVSTVQNCLGDYAMMAPPNLLMAKRSDGHPCDVADLHGKRLVIVSETKDGQRLDEGLVKSLTGGDRIRARRMRENYWEFIPSHTPLMSTNHKPVVRGNDYGIWRRLRLIPFEVTIPPEAQDKQLTEKLKAELPAIAAWLVTGCLQWQQTGLADPAKVLIATDAYKAESDTFAQWFEERISVEGLGEIKASEAFKDYLSWCDANDERKCSRTKFGERIGEYITGKRVSNGTYYEGVAWKN